MAILIFFHDLFRNLSDAPSQRISAKSLKADLCPMESGFPAEPGLNEKPVFLILNKVLKVFAKRSKEVYSKGEFDAFSNQKDASMRAFS
jgi:hypothetical protein